MDVDNFTVKLEEDEVCSFPDQITIELNSFGADGNGSSIVDQEYYNGELEDDDDEDEEDDDEGYVIKSEDEEDDEDDNEIEESFSKSHQRTKNVNQRGGSICVVRKPHCTKLEQSSQSSKLKRQAQESNQPRKRGCSAKQALTTLRHVVSDAPNENKLKKPGPFQAASKVASVSNLKLRHSWLKKPKQAYSDAEDESLTIADEETNETSSVSCSYCGVLLSSALECDLHIVAQHKFEKAVQEIPLKCLEEGCVIESPTIYDLKRHLILSHSIEMMRRNLTFKNMEEFQTWKTDLESTNGTRFRFFSCVSEVTGGTTRVYVCNNEGRYDMTRAKHQRRRRGLGSRPESGLKRTGRACPAQLLVRAWGWGAVEVHALLTHYGHCRDGAIVGVLATTEVAGGLKGDDKEDSGTGGGTRQGRRPLEYAPVREDGVRIIEGALIGSRGMEDLQTDLTAWNLVDNVSICLCKRRHEEDELGLCRPEDFALGFTTSDQLDLWAERGHCAVCLDTSQVRMSNTKDSGPPEAYVSVTCVLVLSERGDACPVAWLLTSCYSDALHRHFLMCLRVAFESFQGHAVPEPRYLVCEASSLGQRLWQDAFKCSPSLLLSSWSVHKLWLPHLYRVQDQDKRLHAYTELCWASRLCDPGDDPAENLTGVLERLEKDPSTKDFAFYLQKEWLPNSSQVSSSSNVLTPEHDSYSTGIYLDILHCLLHFLFVEEQFSLDYDECVAKLNLYSATVLSATKVDQTASNSVAPTTTVTPLAAPSESATPLVTPAVTSKQLPTPTLTAAPLVTPTDTATPLSTPSGTATPLATLAPNNAVTSDSDVSLPRCRAALLIAARHAEAATLGPGSVASVKPHEWQVRCHVQSGVWYSVRRLTRSMSLKSMCSSSCRQACWQCEVCVHQYSCTCPDSIILSTVCVHIHLIRILMRNPRHGSQANANSTQANIIPVGINNVKLLKSKEKMKLSIRNKCSTLLSLMKTNAPPTSESNGSTSSSQWSKERLSKCEALLDQALASLRGQTTPVVEQPAATEAAPSLLLHDRSTTVLSNAQSSDMQMLYSGQENGSSETSRVPLHPTYSEAQTLGAEISTVESLLVLHEENGRFRLVGGGEEDLLQEPTTAKDPPSELIYLDDAQRPRIEGAALGDADSTSAELAGEDVTASAKNLVLETVSSCAAAGSYR